MKRYRITHRAPLWYLQEKKYFLFIIPYWKTLMFSPFLYEAETELDKLIK